MQWITQNIVHLLDPESAHEVSKKLQYLLPLPLLGKKCHFDSDRLKTYLAETSLSNPIGLAGGFDKNAELVPLLDNVGFGFLELGSVTAEPCLGQPKPRIFRLKKDKALINRMGLPNKGADVVSEHLRNLRPSPKTPWGVNISKTPDFAKTSSRTAIQDYLYSLEKLYPVAEYICVNLSCPNTKDSKTFEEPKLFEELAKQLNEFRKSRINYKPILIKLSPNLDAKPLKQTVELALKYNIDGFVVSNTTTEKNNLITPQKDLKAIGAGGLSGKPLLEAANKQLKRVYDITEGKSLLIGVGGVMDFESLLQKICYGAQLVQVYTGFVYNGLFFVHNLAKKLDQFCINQGLSHYSEMIGRQEFLRLKSV